MERRRGVESRNISTHTQDEWFQPKSKTCGGRICGSEEDADDDDDEGDDARREVGMSVVALNEGNTARTNASKSRSANSSPAKNSKDVLLLPAPAAVLANRCSRASRC